MTRIVAKKLFLAVLMAGVFALSMPGRAAQAPATAYWVDESVSAEFAQVSAAAFQSQFRPVDKPLNFGLTQSAIWLRVDLMNVVLAEEGALFEIGRPFTDQIDVYFLDVEGGLIERQLGGDMRRFDQRPLPHAKNLFPIPLSTRAATAFIRVKSEGSMAVSVKLRATQRVLSDDSGRQLAFGLFFGIMLAIILNNSFICAALRDVSYLYNVCYLITVSLLIMTLNGQAGMWFWPESEGITNTLACFFFGSVIAVGAQFIRHFIQTFATAPKFDLHLKFIAGLGAVLALGCGLIPYRIAISTLTLAALYLLIAGFITTVVAYRSGYKPARFLILGMCMVVPGGFVLVGRSYGVLEDSLLTEFLVEFLLATEAVLLAFALADRIKLIEDAKQRAQFAVAEARDTFTRRLITAQEADRKRIAGELHDSIGQTLLYIRNQLRRLRGKSEAAAGLDEITAVAGDSIDEVRAIAQDLHPHQLERLGLKTGLEDLIQKLGMSGGLKTVVEIDQAADDLPASRQITLYRLVQEALNNTLKHAEAATCELALKIESGACELTIGDDGKGLDWDEAVATGHFGLANMQERIRLVGGTLRHNGGPGRGTQLVITLFAEEGPYETN
ncbi:7TM diverse intracellular signaling domain-containing protein [Pelagibius sp. Alg239-R121]|uniref:sensor histidine kinase n=1 Tax=Pelagibius sp. Alg239-R121 TaxID=2993448 RepID=UPI0024A6E2B0|nr:7TM diverse intracellular signaling domain-containing protein [Pelagibius sp. Alg239-R121]